MHACRKDTVLLAIMSLGLWLLYAKTAGRTRLLCPNCHAFLGHEED